MGLQGGVESVEARARQRDLAVDPATRKERGVVHTPAAIARFVALEADRAVREDLGRARGLAAPDLVLVDPATGPGIFLAAAIEVAGARGRPRAAIGLDIDARAIEVAREELGFGPWPLRLQTQDALASLAPVPALEDRRGVRVVLGNPPWASKSADLRRVDALLDDFRRDPRTGEPLRERKLGVLSDDYVRFLRWALEVVRAAEGGGVVAMVTNGSFLDGPVHRGMRAAMRQWCDRIDVVDLGGSALLARGRERDENVFGVRPSVAITIAVRRPGPEPRHAWVRVARVRGSRAEKLGQLALGLEALGPVSVEPALDGAWRSGAPVEADYLGWPSLAEWMPFHREGLQSNRDALVLDADRDALLGRLARLAAGELSPPSSAHWSADEARAAAREVLADPGTFLRRIAYRPFDARWAAIHPGLCHRPRPELARAMDRSAFALLTARKDRGSLPWSHGGAVALLPDSSWLSTRSSCRTRAFPLARPDGGPNLDPALADRSAVALGEPLDVERFALWALAHLFSAAYRARFDAALRADYPRIPPPPDPVAFALGVAAGRRVLAALLTAPADGLPIGHNRASVPESLLAMPGLAGGVEPDVAGRPQRG